jgi:hypothetical protein
MVSDFIFFAHPRPTRPALRRARTVAAPVLVTGERCFLFFAHPALPTRPALRGARTANFACGLKGGLSPADNAAPIG